MEIYDQIQAGTPILDLELPFQIPPEMFHDFLLNQQKTAFINLNHPKLPALIAAFLQHCYGANEAFEQYQPKWVIASHQDSIRIAFVWQAIRRKIPVYIIDSDFNTLRIWNITAHSHIFDYGDRPSPEVVRQLPCHRLDQYEQCGRDYLRNRMAGKTDDLGARYAFQGGGTTITRRAICQQLGWDPQRPLVAVYASNWFDYPHTYGMRNFTDFHDWTTELARQAALRPDVNWLFKEHPCDEWYGGIRLQDILATMSGSSNMAPTKPEWTGQELIKSVDGIITYHGTVGIEATILKTPVLVADRGWYDNWEFVIRSPSRAAFLQTLQTDWWSGRDLDTSARWAAIFGGLFWGRPAWQKDLALPDDCRQCEAYQEVAELVARHRSVLDQEIESIKEWIHLGEPHYHAWKMLQTESHTI